VTSRRRPAGGGRGPATGRRPAAREVEEALGRIPATVVPIIEVLKHGDFVPSNLIVTGPGRLTLIDPVLRDVGLPGRPGPVPLGLVVGDRFVADAVVPGPARRRRDLEETFRAAAGPTGNDPVCWSCACSDSTSSAGGGVAG
jgi:hypothetical protein